VVAPGAAAGGGRHYDVTASACRPASVIVNRTTVTDRPPRASFAVGCLRSVTIGISVTCAVSMAAPSASAPAGPISFPGGDDRQHPCCICCWPIDLRTGSVPGHSLATQGTRQARRK
jgi:hypothetical protein